jgi:hypothetical protein
MLSITVSPFILSGVMFSVIMLSAEVFTFRQSRRLSSREPSQNTNLRSKPEFKRVEVTDSDCKHSGLIQSRNQLR